MAKQEYGSLRREFTLDLHNVQAKEAARITRIRIAECFQHGMRSLKCAFGSPDNFRGSIAEAVIDIAFTDERVASEALAEWVFADEINVLSMPIFLVLPLRPNQDSTTLTPHSSFAGFTAAFEPKASLRLLCKMPFQPLRDLYELPYAARAIGNGCKESSLRQYCAAVGLTGYEEGLTLSSLLSCCDGFGAWKTRKTELKAAPASVPQLKETIDRPPFYPHAQPRTVDALLQQAERQLSDIEYDECRETLEIVSELLETDAQRLRYELLLGRRLQSEDQAECEGHLLKADQLCISRYGRSSPQRVPVLRALASWYGRSGEVSELLALSGAAEMIELSVPEKMPIKKRFVNDFGYARLLRQAGMYQESVYVLRQFIWRGLMEKTEEMPDVFGPTLELLLDGKVSRVQIANMNLLYAMNCTDDGDGDFELAVFFLNLSHRLLMDIGGQEVLRSEIEQERGRIERKRGQIDKALRHYEAAIKLIKEAKIDDPYRSYELYLSRGVAKVQKGDLRSAAADYERSWALAQSLELTEQVFVYPLLLSRATLALRNKNFTECERLASEAADLLSLKASQRHKDIGLARFRQGAALCHLEDYKRGLQALKEAEQEFAIAGTFGPHRGELEGYLRLATAKVTAKHLKPAT